MPRWPVPRTTAPTSCARGATVSWSGSTPPPPAAAATEPEDELLSLLQSLADMDITYKALQETDIGRHVNGLRKHPSGEVRLLAISSSSSSSASPWTGSSAAATAASWRESGSGSAMGSTTVVAVAGSTGISATSCFSLPWNPSPRW
uniref:TFIIS N-terminal domain-containing protein n=2 Tax=Oryza TaxID=4527 RepID=A0A0E0PDI0_ORYRU